MFSKTRKPLSLVLVFVMALTLVGINPTQAKAEEVGVDFVRCNIEVNAPYQEYYTGFDDAVELVKSDLDDDFGLGLSTGSEAKFTAIRAIAKMIRTGVMKEKNISDVSEANKLMKNYIDVAESTYGLTLNGLSNDGVNWNTGAYKEAGTTAVGDFSTVHDGYWGFYVDGGYASEGVGTYEITVNEETIQLRWVHHLNDGYSDHAVFEVPNSGWLQSGKKNTISLTATDYSGTKKNITNADVTVTSYGIGSDTPKVVKTVKTDANGKFDLNLSAGAYLLSAVADVYDETTKLTHSSIEHTDKYIYVVDAPAKAKSIKSKVKKSGKKYNLTLTWRNGSKYADARTVYQVYISKKKKSGYGKAKATADGNYPRAVIKKLKKGTYYVKIQATTYYGNDDEVSYKSGYTTPKKIKVK